jgi:hypothetical protein
MHFTFHISDAIIAGHACHSNISSHFVHVSRRRMPLARLFAGRKRDTGWVRQRRHRWPAASRRSANRNVGAPGHVHASACFTDPCTDGHTGPNDNADADG